MYSDVVTVLDAPRILAIDQQSNPQPWSAKEYAICLSDSRCKTLSIKEGEKLIGYSMFILMPTYTHWVHLRVDSEYRKEGLESVSEKLVQDTVKFFKENKVTTPIRFEVATRNKVVWEYAKKYLGATIDSIKKDYYGINDDAFFMSIEKIGELNG